MASFFPKALVYKEWKQQRLWAVLLLLLIGVPPALRLLMDLITVWTSPIELQYGAIGGLLIDLKQYLNIPGIYVSTTMFDLLPIGVLAFGTAVLSYERSQGGLWYTLAGPVTRRQVLRTKIALGWAQVVAIITLFAVGMWIVDGLGHTGIPFQYVLRWWGVEVCTNTAMLLVGVLAATLVGNVLAAPLMGLALGGLPIAIGVVVEVTFGLTWSRGGMVHYSFVELFGKLSPLYYLKSSTAAQISPLIYAAGMFIWAVAAYLLAQYFFRKSRMECMSNFFVFPVLWRLFITMLAIGFGLIATGISSHGRPMTITDFTVRWVIFSATVWGVLRLFIGFYRKRFVEA